MKLRKITHFVNWGSFVALNSLFSSQDFPLKVRVVCELTGAVTMNSYSILFQSEQISQTLNHTHRKWSEQWVANNMTASISAKGRKRNVESTQVLRKNDEQRDSPEIQRQITVSSSFCWKGQSIHSDVATHKEVIGDAGVAFKLWFLPSSVQTKLLHRSNYMHDRTASTQRHIDLLYDDVRALAVQQQPRES